MKVVGLILCRKGSKGVPGKNKRLLCGKHMFSYQVKNLKDAGVEDVYVSTDDPDIKALSSEYNFITIDRPAEISGDTAKCEQALSHFSNIVDYDVLVFAQATSPMCPPKYLKKGTQMVINKECDSVVSVIEEHWLPRWDKEMNPINWKTEKRPRRQDRESVYTENGAFYITTREAFEKSGIRYSGKILPVVMPHYESFQIDTEEDFFLISKMMDKK